jgi:hypothetical protein
VQSVPIAFYRGYFAGVFPICGILQQSGGGVRGLHKARTGKEKDDSIPIIFHVRDRRLQGCSFFGAHLCCPEQDEQKAAHKDARHDGGPDLRLVQQLHLLAL